MSSFWVASDSLWVEPLIILILYLTTYFIECSSRKSKGIVNLFLNQFPDRSFLCSTRKLNSVCERLQSKHIYTLNIQQIFILIFFRVFYLYLVKKEEKTECETMQVFQARGAITSGVSTIIARQVSTTRARRGQTTLV